MPSNKILDDLKTLNKKLKSLLVTEYGKEYIVLSPVNKESDAGSASDVLTFFTVDKSSYLIRNNITSAESLNQIKDMISADYEQFSRDVIDFYEKISPQLDEQTSKSINIIAKTFKARNRKLDTALKRFMIQGHWKHNELGSEFESILIKFLSDLIESTIRPISVGIKKNSVSSVYQTLLGMFNRYLSELGVYTIHYDVGHKLSEDDWCVLTPVDADDCETSDKSLKDVIKSVGSYPYFIGDNMLVLEGDVVLWRVNNG